MHCREHLLYWCFNLWVATLFKSKKMKLFEHFEFILILAVIIFMILTSGCSTIENMRDPDYSQGCRVIEGEAKLGALNQQGIMVVCKLKCSAELPDGLSYKYHNTRTGCHVEISK